LPSRARILAANRDHATRDMGSGDFVLQLFETGGFLRFHPAAGSD
jgi:hypothetical protein